MDARTFVATCDRFFGEDKATDSWSSTAYEGVYKEARNYISDPEQVILATQFLRQQIVILHHQHGIDYSKYCPVLDSIRETARTELDKTSIRSEETNWEQLIKIMLDNRHQLYSFKTAVPSLLDSKLDTFATSYIRLKNLGVEFKEDNYEIYISETSYNLINSEIDLICRTYGGEELLISLMTQLGRTYNPITGRFMEYRHVSMGTSEVFPAMPFGYLLAIASKYAGTKGNNDPVLYQRLSMIIADLIIIYEIQPYSQFEAIHIKSEYFGDFMRKNILYDNFVGCSQVKASYATSIIKFLHRRFEASGFESFGVKFIDVTRVSQALISLADTRRFKSVSIKDIVSKTKMSPVKVVAAMEKLMSVPAGIVNSDLQFPPSSLNIDHHFKPAIKIGGNYKIFPKSIASLGCINTVCDSISRPNGKWENKIDSELGYAIEDYLRDALADKGIFVVSGDREGGGTDLEVDLLCETSEDIYIFEMKKKGLTRKSQAGDEGQLFSDLADSVLRSHSQAMRIENALKNNEALHLDKNGVKHTVKLNNRQVRRISVSMSDFGALQDKTVLQRLLTVAVTSTVSHSISGADGKLDKWREYADEIKTLALSNGEFDKGRVPFHHSLFMSIPQIILVLDNSSSPEEFFTHIKNFISVSTGSRDTYTEFLNRLNFLGRLEEEGPSF